MNLDIQRILVVRQNEYPSLHIEDRVMGIDLTNNNLKSMEAVQMPLDIIYLQLSNNKLRSLPDKLLNDLRDLKRVSLSKNPWDCNCKSLGFKQWLLSHKNIVRILFYFNCF